MPEFARQLSSIGADILAFAWLPLLIWTLLAVVVLAILRLYRKIHVQYHYHARLALMLALPVGLLLASLMDLAAVWMAAGAESTSAMKFIVVQSPLEVTAGSTEAAPLLFSPEVWYGAFTVLFLIGATYFSIRHLFQYIQLKQLTRQITFTPLLSLDEVTDQNKALARTCGKPVSVGYLDRAVIPVTYGVRKPVILLPAELSDDTEKMNLVLRHELVHIKNRDYPVHLMMAGIRTLFWLHPVVHLLYHQLIDYREMRCDCHVLSDDSVSRKKYALVLLELLPMPNLNKNVSVNMAQESSNLKKRIDMMKTNTIRSIPFKASLALFCSVILAIVLAMSCTDMQQHAVFDEEELDLMTNMDKTGERGYHEIIIFLSDEDQADRHDGSIRQIEALQPEHIQSVNVLKGEVAIEEYGSRGAQGVIVVRTRQDIDSYNRALKALGMEPVDPPPQAQVQPDHTTDDDVYTVVEQMPELIGGLASIQRTIRYPEEARRDGIEGRVYVQFTVNEEGGVEDARVIRGIGGGADEEALRAVRQAEFHPGMQRGEPVKVRYSLPIVFRLAGETNNQSETSQTQPSPSQDVTNNDTETSQSEHESDNDLTVSDIISTGSTNIEAPEVNYKQFDIQNLHRDGDVIQGRVTDTESGQPLAGANIVIENTSTGTVTDPDGEFNISVEPTGNLTLHISYIGYERVEVNI